MSCLYTCTSSFARFATPPTFACMSNPALDSSLCRAAAPRFASASAAAPQLRPLQMLHSDCVRFSCCSPLVSASSLQLLHPFRLLLPDCNRFNSSSLTASASTAAPRSRPLRLLLPSIRCSPSCSGRFQPMPGTISFQHSLQSSRFKYKGRTSLV